MRRLFVLFLLLPVLIFSQENKKIDKVKLIHSDKIESRQDFYQGNIFYTGNVVFQHQNGTLKADTIVVYQKERNLKAFSNVDFSMDDNKLTANQVVYDDATEIAEATGEVVLRNKEQTLYTDKLIYDRKINQAYYNSGGTIISEDNEINSQIGIYDLNTKSNIFKENVIINNKDYFIESKDMKYFSNGDYMEFYDQTFIQNKKNPKQFIKTTKGKYYLSRKEAYLENRSSVHSDGNIITAQDLYFNQNSGYGKGQGNVLIENPEDRQYIKGGLGEFFKKNDSAYVTQNAYAVKIFEKDSFYLHADTLMTTKKFDKGLIRAYHKAKYFKSNLQGKADSITFSEAIGEMRFFKDPVVWSGFRQITGDTIFVYSNIKAERLDSVIIRENAFAVSKTDSISKEQYHQLKSRKMLGIFVDEELDWVQAEGNAQSLVYVIDEKNENQSTTLPQTLIGINRSDCGIIEADFEQRDINVISCKIKATSKFYPPSKIPENERKLPDFIWRDAERPKVWQDIFD